MRNETWMTHASWLGKNWTKKICKHTYIQLTERNIPGIASCFGVQQERQSVVESVRRKNEKKEERTVTRNCTEKGQERSCVREKRKENAGKRTSRGRPTETQKITRCSTLERFATCPQWKSLCKQLRVLVLVIICECAESASEQSGKNSFCGVPIKTKKASCVSL